MHQSQAKFLPLLLLTLTSVLAHPNPRAGPNDVSRDLLTGILPKEQVTVEGSVDKGAEAKAGKVLKEDKDDHDENTKATLIVTVVEQDDENKILKEKAAVEDQKSEKENRDTEAAEDQRSKNEDRDTEVVEDQRAEEEDRDTEVVEDQRAEEEDRDIEVVEDQRAEEDDRDTEVVEDQKFGKEDRDTEVDDNYKMESKGNCSNEECVWENCAECTTDEKPVQEPQEEAMEEEEFIFHYPNIYPENPKPFPVTYYSVHDNSNHHFSYNSFTSNYRPRFLTTEEDPGSRRHRFRPLDAIEQPTSGVVVEENEHILGERQVHIPKEEEFYTGPGPIVPVNAYGVHSHRSTLRPPKSDNLDNLDNRKNNHQKRSAESEPKRLPAHYVFEKHLRMAESNPQLFGLKDTQEFREIWDKGLPYPNAPVKPGRVNKRATGLAYKKDENRKKGGEEEVS